MKKLQIISKVTFLLLASCFLLQTVSAQAPQKMSYQAVIRNLSNQLVTTQVGMQISILQGTSTGTPVYVETQTPTPNSNGLVSMEIGGGTPVIGTFTGIDWSVGPYYIKTETAVTAPLTNYTITGTSQILSVPYALYAKSAGNVEALKNEILQIQADMGLKDADGNSYKAVKIGTQVWMGENLKTTKYNDGSSIPNVTDDNAWDVLSTPAYAWYKNDAATYKNPYGAMYNWYSVSTGKLCPTGWHVPTDGEWHTLALTIDPGAVLSGTETLLGGKLKETGTAHWTSPNTDATNESGFTAVAAGNREDNIPGGYDPSTNFEGIGIGACFWTSTEFSANIAWYRNLAYNAPQLARLAGTNQSKRFGYSVRCLKDVSFGTAIPTDGLIAYYPFNGNANDASGNGHNGNVYGATLTTDRFGNTSKAYSFDGVNDYISFGAFHPVWYNFTLSFWIKPIQFKNEPDGVLGDACTNGLFVQQYNTQFAMVTQGGGGGIFTTLNPQDINQWAHYSFVMQQGAATFYKNGILIGTAAQGGSPPPGGANFEMGRDMCQQSLYWNGCLSDIRIYNRALNPSEISALYHEGGWSK